MKRLNTFLLSVGLLAIPFGLACAAAAAVALITLLLWAVSGAQSLYVYTKNLLGGMDRTTAGLMGLDAKFTVSAHCGALTRDFLKPLRNFLDWVSPGHCEGAAKNEGLL